MINRLTAFDAAKPKQSQAPGQTTAEKQIGVNLNGERAPRRLAVSGLQDQGEVAHTRAMYKGKAPDAKVLFVGNTRVECTARPRSVEQGESDVH